MMRLHRASAKALVDFAGAPSVPSRRPCRTARLCPLPCRLVSWYYAAMDARIDELFDTWATSYRREAANDNYAWALEPKTVSIGDPEQNEDRGKQLVDDFIETVATILGFRALRPADKTEVDWTRKFLHLQRYRVDDKSRGAKYQVYLLGGLELPLYVNDLGDLDFEDLLALEYFTIHIYHNRGELSDEQAQQIAEHIHDDLNSDGEVGTTWYHMDQSVVVTIDD